MDLKDTTPEQLKAMSFNFEAMSDEQRQRMRDLFYRMMNNKVANALHELQDVREMFLVLYGINVGLLDKYHIIHVQSELATASVDKLWSLLRRINSEFADLESMKKRGIPLVVDQ